MSTNMERSPDSHEAIALLDDGDLAASTQTKPAADQLAGATREAVSATNVMEVASVVAEVASAVAEVASVITLAELPCGARLVLRCRKDWRAAAVSAVTCDCVVLTVASPTGHTYRVRRPGDSVLTFDGAIPILSDRDSACWRVALARYDARW